MVLSIFQGYSNIAEMNNVRAIIGCAAGLVMSVMPAQGAPPQDTSLFTDVTAKVGLHEGMADYPPGTYLTPEITPGGVALIDFDRDGLLDVLAVCHPPPGGVAGLSASAPCKLFRQNADGAFIKIP